MPLSSSSQQRTAIVTLASRATGQLTQVWGELFASQHLAEGLQELCTPYGLASSTLAADWYEGLRDRLNPSRPFQVDLSAPPSSGLYAWMADRATEGDPNTALVRTQGSVQKAVASGHRRTIAKLSTSDPAAEGWRRMGVGANCDFCQKLISPGAVYRKETSKFAAHDHCNCIAEPAFKGATATLLDAPVVQTTDLTELPPVPPAVIKTQLTGSFAPKPAPKPAPIIKTQLSGSFAPKIEKTQLTGGFAPNPVVKPSAPVKPNVKISLSRVKAEAAKPKPPAAERPRRTFTSKTDGKTWASDIWGGPQSHGKDELTGLRIYTGSGYRTINQALRRAKGGPVKSRQRVIEAMDSAIAKAPRVPEPITTVRATTEAQFGLQKGADLSQLVGQQFTEHAYLSTSVDSRAAFSGLPVRMKVNVPEGHPAVYVSGGPKGSGVISSVGGNEAELILARGSQFVVKSVRHQRGQWIVEADILP